MCDGSPSAAPDTAISLLMDCLNDPDPWEAEALVGRLEAVFTALGGIIEDGEAHV